MDLFDTNRDSFKAMDLLGKTALNDVFINYQTLREYSHSINMNKMQSTS